MSYCRWSCENGYSDIYAYSTEGGGISVHVASRRRPPGRPKGFLEVFYEQVEADGEFDHAACEAARKATEAWDAEHPHEEIDHEMAGTSHGCADAEDALALLEELKEMGFVVPQAALDELRQEIHDDREKETS